MKILKRFGLVMVALVIGIIIGGSGKPAPVAVSEPVPAPTVTVTSEPEVTTVEKVVEKTPAVCLEALDLAQQGFTHASEGMGHLSDALQAAGRFDVAAMEEASAKMRVLNPKIAALTEPMQRAVAGCRAKQ